MLRVEIVEGGNSSLSYHPQQSQPSTSQPSKPSNHPAKVGSANLFCLLWPEKTSVILVIFFFFYFCREFVKIAQNVCSSACGSAVLQSAIGLGAGFGGTFSETKSGAGRFGRRFEVNCGE